MGSFVMDIYKNRLDGKYLKTDGTIADDFTILKKNLRLNDIGNYTICEGDSLSLQANFSGGSDSISYLWSPGSITNPVVSLAPIGTTNYTLTVTDLLTGQTETTSIIINVTTLPIPSIAETNDTLQTVPGYSYQWYLAGNPISGATSFFYVPAMSGSYSVEIINGICSTTSSDYIFNMNVGGFEEQDIEKVFVFPNPSSDIVYFKSESYTGLHIYDMLGNELYASNENKKQHNISILNWASGVYTYRILLNNMSQFGKFIKN